MIEFFPLEMMPLNLTKTKHHAENSLDGIKSRYRDTRELNLLRFHFAESNEVIIIVFDKHKDSYNQEINVHNEMNSFDVASFK